PLIAVVELAEMTPGATFWICRSPPATPTLTTPLGAAVEPAAVPPNSAYVPVLKAAVVELEPNATSPAVVFAVAPLPSATAPATPAVEVLPSATEPVPVAVSLL